MDKSFNDDELADIMSEIEDLEKEFAASQDEAPIAKVEEVKIDEAVTTKAEVSEVESGTALVEEDYTEPEVVQAVAEASEIKILKKAKEENVISLAENKPNRVESQPVFSGASTSLNFAIQGEMSMNLNFNINGQTVELNIDDQGLCIQMQGGGKFVLPLDQRNKAKKVA